MAVETVPVADLKKTHKVAKLLQLRVTFYGDRAYRFLFNTVSEVLRRPPRHQSEQLAQNLVLVPLRKILELRNVQRLLRFAYKIDHSKIGQTDEHTKLLPKAHIVSLVFSLFCSQSHGTI